MSIEFKRLTVGNSPYVSANMFCGDYRIGLVMFSALGFDTSIKEVVAQVNRANNVYCEGLGSHNTGGSDKFEVYRSKDGASDYSHVICIRKDTVSDNGVITSTFVMDKELNFNLMDQKDYTEDFLNAFYQKLYEATPTPIIPEWSSYLAHQLASRGQLFKASRYFATEGTEYTAFIIRLTAESLFEIVSNGLKRGDIQVNGSNRSSSEMKAVEGMDQYLEAFSGILADKIQTSFEPKFVPGKGTYNENLQTFSDYVSYRGVDLYDAQKAVMQASSNNLDKNDVSFIIGEMGTGRMTAVLGRNS